jgi:dolichol-phosphate mannosyltransferase
MLFARSTVAMTGLGLASAMFFIGGLLFLSLGVLGEYIGRVYDEVRNRPVSLISTVHRSHAEIATQVGMMTISNGSFPVQENYSEREATQAA